MNNLFVHSFWFQTHKQPVTEYEAIREKAASQKRDVERALTRFIARTGETHSLFLVEDTNVFPRKSISLYCFFRWNMDLYSLYHELQSVYIRLYKQLKKWRAQKSCPSLHWFLFFSVYVNDDVGWLPVESCVLRIRQWN